MRLTRLYIGRLCFKLSLAIAIAGHAISGLKTAPVPSFPAFHF